MKSLLLKVFLSAFIIVSFAVNSNSQSNYVTFSSIPENGNILIYSHMDDDLIWMLPFWKITGKFISGAMPATPSYRTVARQIEQYLTNNSTGISYEPNWFTPWDDITDQEYNQYYLGANPLYDYLLNDHLETRLYNNPTELSRYEINKLKAKLEQFFADPSMSRVITHNNWGEYGHQHHKAVNKAVRELAVKYRKDVWMLGCNNGAFADVNVPDNITYTIGSFNTPDLYTDVRQIYLNNGRWTWYTDRVPSGDHKFIKIVDAGNDKSNILTGELITYPGPSQQEPGAYIFDGTDDYLTLKGNQYPSFTISMRIRPDEIKDMDIANMSEYPGSSTCDRSIILNARGKISAIMFDGSPETLVSASTVSAGMWTHLAITSDGRTFRLFINGKPDTSTDAGTASVQFLTPEFVIGLASATSSCFRGQINDVRLFDRALSDNEIARISGAGYTIYSSAGTGGTISPSGSLSVPAGSNLSFSIKPDNNYEISQVSVDNTPVGQVSGYMFTNILANHTISAAFRRITFTFSASAATGGRIDPEGEFQVSSGTSQSFRIIPDEGFAISDVFVDNSSVGPVKDYFFSDVTSVHTIRALFAPVELKAESSAGEGGKISPYGESTVNFGNDISYTITPDQGFRISDVIVDNVSLGAIPNYTFNKVTSDHRITVIFEPITYSITCLAGNGGSINPGGTSLVKYGANQQFTVTPAYGYRIASIILDGIAIEIGTGEVIIENVKSDHTLSVIFEPLKAFTIKTGNTSGGIIFPSGNLNFFEGTDTTFRIIPDRGFRISEVIVDSVSLGPVTDYTFHNILSDHRITAVFSRDISVELYPIPFRTSLTVVIRSPFNDQFDLYFSDIANRLIFMEPDIPANTVQSFNPAVRPGLYLVSIYLREKRIGSWKIIRY